MKNSDYIAIFLNAWVTLLNGKSNGLYLKSIGHSEKKISTIFWRYVLNIICLCILWQLVFTTSIGLILSPKFNNLNIVNHEYFIILNSIKCVVNYINFNCMSCIFVQQVMGFNLMSYVRACIRDFTMHKLSVSSHFYGCFSVRGCNVRWVFVEHLAKHDNDVLNLMVNNIWLSPYSVQGYLTYVKVTTPVNVE